MSSLVKEQLREAGYEALHMLGGYFAWSMNPTGRHFDDVLRWIDEIDSRRQLLKQLEKRGLVESGLRKGQWVPLLTERGRSALAGGREPGQAWDRPWDQRWRLLTFDLPRKDSAARMKLRRWMCENHFGRLQGSVWISPDPLEGIDELAGRYGIKPDKMMVFEGTPAGGKPAKEISAIAWDFNRINEGYRDYMRFAERTLRTLRESGPKPARVKQLLLDDRKRWWEPVRRDPLLPRVLHPKGYEGPAAWKVRGRLHRSLAKAGDVGG